MLIRLVFIDSDRECLIIHATGTVKIILDRRGSVAGIGLQHQDGRHFTNDIFKCIFLKENIYSSIKISLKFAPKGPISIIPALVHIMAWRRPGDKPLPEPLIP